MTEEPDDHVSSCQCSDTARTAGRMSWHAMHSHADRFDLLSLLAILTQINAKIAIEQAALTAQANVATAKTTPPSHATETAGLEALKYITKIY